MVIRIKPLPSQVNLVKVVTPFFLKNNFAWLLDEREEQGFIKLMKRATNLMIIARTSKGAEQQIIIL